MRIDDIVSATEESAVSDLSGDLVIKSQSCHIRPAVLGLFLNVLFRQE